MFNRLLRTLAVLVSLVPALAQAQPIFSNLPSGTVVGRLLTGSGPAQAIPLATLGTNIFQLGFCTTSGAFPIYNATSGLWVCSTVGGTGSQVALNGGPLTITGATNSLLRGLSISLTAPTSGSSSGGPGSFNSMTVTNGFSVTGPAGSTNGLLNAAFRGLYVEFDDSGNSNVTSAATFLIVNTGSTANDKVGLAASAYSNFNSNPNYLLGLGGRSVVGPSAVQGYVVGSQMETEIQSGATVTNRIGLEITNTGVGQGGTYDAAIAVDSTTSGGQFKNLIALGSPAATQTPIATTGYIFVPNTALTVADFCHCGNITFTGNIWDTPQWSVTGTGNATFGIPIGSLNAAYNVQVSGTSKGSVGFAVSTNTTTGFDGVLAVNSTSGVEIDILANEASRTATFLGQTTGNWGEIIANGNGILLGTSNSSPVVIGTNNVERGRWNAAGGLTVTQNSIGVTSTDGYVSQNTTAASAGTQQWAPRVHLIGQGWQTTTPQSETAEWIAEVKPTIATIHPNNLLVFSAQVNGGGYLPVITFSQNGGGGNGNTSLIFNSTSAKNANLIYQDNGANVWYLQNLGGTSDQLTLLNSDANSNLTILTITNSSGLITLNQLSTDNTHVTRTVCQDTTSKAIYFGSGASGICLGTSGAQFKNLVGLTPSVLDKLAGLPVRDYYYKQGYGDNGEHLQHGPTAQDVAPIFPDLVRYNERGDAVNYDWGALVFLELRAIQELKADNDNLRAEMTLLKQRVSR